MGEIDFNKYLRKKDEEARTLKGFLKEYTYYPVYRFINRVKEVPRDARAFWQRGKRGYADRDCWDLSGYLSSWMPEALRTMTDKKQGGGNGYPGVKGAETFSKWNKIVDRMARGFEADRILQDEMIDRRTPRGRKLMRQRKKAFKLFEKWYDALWD